MPHEVHAYKGITTTGMIDDFSGNAPDDVGYVGGFNLVTVSMGMATLSIFAQPGSLISKPGSRGNWCPDLVRLMDNYTHLAGLHFVGEDMPNPNNGVTLHPTAKDAFGMPVSVLEYNDHPNNVAMRRRGWDKAKEIFEAAGAEEILEVPPFPDTHLLGTCRMGDDPATSVVNRYGRAHDVENLFIADGSVFPTSTAENPSLTISALAIRQAHHMMSIMAGEEEEATTAIGLGPPRRQRRGAEWDQPLPVRDPLPAPAAAGRLRCLALRGCASRGCAHGRHDRHPRCGAGRPIDWGTGRSW
ncbi:hypothetical protein ISU10_18500 [Nocardioides agariphilus]|uniref:Glucose-methanol-choline oxidoreductase C-terminal domain-containing protein n=1 Tax=Nocardioides agariphilus TaxID=433664 RepID=A0A930VTT1_9ACTN|nr:GMC family oxidoreductase [Nocardioides agariphilus]MBF4769765.1 hypothetical protein [Nocardioides agariphilus]